MMLTHNRYQQLDGLRGLAAFVVLVSHVACAFYPALFSYAGGDTHTVSQVELWLVNTPFNCLFNGELAVAVFFVISGFVLSTRYFNTLEKRPVVAAIIKRYPRLMVLVWLSVLFSFVLQQSGVYGFSNLADITRSDWLKQLFTPAQTFTELLKNIGYQQFLKHNTPTPLNPVLWTISLELKGSLLVFIVLLLLPKNKFRYAVYALLVVYFFKTYYILFVAGLILSDIGSTPLKKLPKLVYVLLCLLVVILCSYKSNQQTILWTWLQPLEPFIRPHFIGAIGLISLILFNPFKPIVLQSKVAQFLGKISYPLYLFHVLILALIAFPQFSYLHQLGVNYHINVLLSCSSAIAVLLLLCKYLLFPLDDWSIKKANQLGLYLTKKLY